MKYPESRGRFWTDDVCTEDLSILVLGRTCNVWIRKQDDDGDLAETKLDGSSQTTHSLESDEDLSNKQQEH